MNEKPKKITALHIERAKPATDAAGNPRATTLTIGRGLFLYITANNGKSWRYQYRLNGRRVIVYGQYPDVSLAQADELHTDARRLIAAGQIPAMFKGKVIAKLDRAAQGIDNRFRAVARDWYRAKLKAARKSGNPLSDSWRDNIKRWLRLANTSFGNKLLSNVDDGDVLALLKNMDSKGRSASAEALRQVLGYLFDWGMLNRRRPQGFNPATALKGAIIVPDKKHRHKLDLKEIGPFLRAIDDSDELEELKLGLKLLLHTFVRRTELIFTPWSEIQGDTWTVPAARMKMGREHVIPLSTQAQAMFSRLKELANGSRYVFPAVRNVLPDGTRVYDPTRPRHLHTFNLALNRLGYKGIFSPHGVRATAASILADRGYQREVVDAQLAHAEDNQTIAAYFRNKYLDQRRTMLQDWSDLIEGLAAGANVVPIKSAA